MAIGPRLGGVFFYMFSKSCKFDIGQAMAQCESFIRPFQCHTVASANRFSRVAEGSSTN